MAEVTKEFNGIKIGDEVQVKTSVGKINAIVKLIIKGDCGTARIFAKGIRSGKMYNAPDKHVTVI